MITLEDIRTAKKEHGRRPVSKFPDANGIKRKPGKVITVAPEIPEVTYDLRIQDTAKNLFKHAVLIAVTFKRPTPAKKVKDKAAIIKAGHNTKRLNVTKSLMGAWPEYAEIERFEQEVREYVRARCVPSNDIVFKQGTYVLPIRNINLIIPYLKEKAAQYPALVLTLKANYQLRIQEDKEILGPDFNIEDYINEEYIEVGENSPFFMDYHLNKVEQPDKNLGEVDIEILREENVKARQRIQRTVAGLEQGLIQAVVEVYRFLLERLSEQPTSTGRRKHIREDSIERRREIVAEFKNLNITGNIILDNEIEKLQKLFDGIDINDIKTDAEVRHLISTAATESLAELGKLVVDAPGRKMTDLGIRKPK